MMRNRGKAAYMISAVAEQYEIHPQTLRLYEREGLLAPSRSEGNTRLYTEEDLERVEIILNMREKMEAMQAQMEGFIGTLNRELSQRVSATGPRAANSNSLMPVIQINSMAVRSERRAGTDSKKRRER
jgi:MerR family transcriptional regulator/heat shock protein HspR